PRSNGSPPGGSARSSHHGRTSRPTPPGTSSPLARPPSPSSSSGLNSRSSQSAPPETPPPGSRSPRRSESASSSSTSSRSSYMSDSTDPTCSGPSTKFTTRACSSMAS